MPVIADGSMTTCKVLSRGQLQLQTGLQISSHEFRCASMQMPREVKIALRGTCVKRTLSFNLNGVGVWYFIELLKEPGVMIFMAKFDHIAWGYICPCFGCQTERSLRQSQEHITEEAPSYKLKSEWSINTHISTAGSAECPSNTTEVNDTHENTALCKWLYMDITYYF